LRIFERAARLKIGGDAGRSEHVAAEHLLEAGRAVADSSDLHPRVERGKGVLEDDLLGLYPIEPAS
jgi:hypothetical protein